VQASSAFAIEADLCTLKGPNHLISEALRLSDKAKIDVLINSAGRASPQPLKDITIEQWDFQVNLNGRGTLLTTQAALPHLAKGARIVNMSSGAARQGYPGTGVYNGTKAMIEAFTRTWAVSVFPSRPLAFSSPSPSLLSLPDLIIHYNSELGREYSCTVNCIAPGATNTDAFNAITGGVREAIEPMLAATPAASRLGEPEEIAHAVAFLCEERSRWITGQVCPSMTMTMLVGGKGMRLGG
jgi:NAD(P)-dependent dehydrogenase (short-subunit alcohol dehydrogenase family)